MKSETFRKQALSLIIFFVAVAAVFFVASRLRGDPAEKQAQTILTLLLVVLVLGLLLRAMHMGVL